MRPTERRDTHQTEAATADLLANLSRSPTARKIVAGLGSPLPPQLERAGATDTQPLLLGRSVLVGATQGASLVPHATALLRDEQAGVRTLAEAGAGTGELPTGSADSAE